MYIEKGERWWRHPILKEDQARHQWKVKEKTYWWSTEQVQNLVSSPQGQIKYSILLIAVFYWGEDAFFQFDKYCSILPLLLHMCDQIITMPSLIVAFEEKIYVKSLHKQYIYSAITPKIIMIYS